MDEKYKSNKKSKKIKTIRAIVSFSQIGLTMVAAVLIGVFLGKFLDDLLGTSPWLLLIFSLIGVVAAIKAIFNVSINKK